MSSNLDKHSMQIKPILIMAGGTGGHVYPALAIAEYLREQGVKLFWLGTKHGLESKVVPKNNFPLITINITGLRGKSIFRWFASPVILLIAIIHSLKVLLNVKPSVVIGMGGFASGPGGIAAWLLRIPLLIHEQNSIAGLSNRILAPFSRTIMQGFPDAFTGRKVVTTGNPVRLEIIQMAMEGRQTSISDKSAPLKLLVLGGSLGAKVLNDLMPAVVSNLPEKIKVDLWHQTGTAHFDNTISAYRSVGVDSGRVVPFIDDMADAYSWADLVICRAGALTVSEISIMGLASILIPYPYAVDDHQTKNARYITDAGGGVLLPQTELSIERLAELISQFHEDRESIISMSNIVRLKAKPEATVTIANLCMEAAHA